MEKINELFIGCLFIMWIIGSCEFKWYEFCEDLKVGDLTEICKVYV